MKSVTRTLWGRWSIVAIAVAVTHLFSIGMSIAAPGSASYVYDNLGRLKSVTYEDGTSVTYGLDAAGNRTVITTTTATIDNTPPSVPTGVNASAASATHVNISWSASNDTGGSGLAGYRVLRNGSQIGTSTSTSYSDSTVSGNTSYSYTVQAFDNANNVSAASSPSSVTTPPAPDNTPPSVPTALTGNAPTSSQVNLSWNPSTDTGGSGLAGYKVFRNGSQIATAASNSYSDNSVSGFVSYTYAVAAYDAANNTSGQSSSFAITTPDTVFPTVPTGLTGSAVSASQVNLSWNAASDSGGSGLAGYKIYRDGAQIGTSATTSYSDTGGQGSTTYSYTVASYDGAGNTSSQSAAKLIATFDTTAPSRPTNVRSGGASASQIILLWDASTDTGGSGLAGYTIYRDGSSVGTVGSATLSFADNGVSGSRTYNYYVVAFDNAGNSAASIPSVNISTPDITPPSVPNPFSATPSAVGVVSLSWGASSDTGGSSLNGYYVYRDGAQLVWTPSTAYDDTSVAGSTTYSYTVAAVDGAGNLSASAGPAVVTTLAAPPSAPTLSAPASATANSFFTLSWTSSPTATTYTLYETPDGGTQSVIYSGPELFFQRTRGQGIWTYVVAACNGAGCTVSNVRQVSVCPLRGCQ